MPDKFETSFRGYKIFFLALWLMMALPCNVSAAHAGKLDAAICAKADLVSGEYEKTLVLPAGAKGFTVAVTSHSPQAVMVELAWEAVKVDGLNNGKRLGQDTLALGPGQTKFVPFRAPEAGLVSGLYRVALSISGQSEKSVGFVVKPIQATATRTKPSPAAGASSTPTKDDNVSDALARVFKTKQGPEAAQEGITVVGDLLDKELSTPAPKDQNKQKPASANKGGQQANNAQPIKSPPIPQTTSGPSRQTATAPDSGQPNQNKPQTPKAAQVQPTKNGGLELVCARSVDSEKKPLDTPATFDTEDARIYLAMRSTDPNLKDIVKVKWLTVKVEGLPAGKKCSSTPTILRINSWNTDVFLPPKGGFWPGEYRVEVLKNDKLLATVDFRIESSHEAALLPDDAVPPAGANLAHQGLGGKVVSATSQANNTYWSKDGLNDGFGYGGENCKPACGWASSDNKFPQEIVFLFNQNRSARLKAMVLDCQSCSGDENCLSSLPRMVEVWVSEQSPDSGYKLAATRQLRPVAARQAIPLSGIQAKYLKLIIKSNYGGSRRTQLAEVEIIEEPGPNSIVKDAPVDLALPCFGGAVIRYTSQKYGGEAVNLLQTREKKDRVWRSADGKLPQEFTLGMRDDGEALIDRLEISLDSGFNPSTRPKEIAVLISTESPNNGFSEVARLEVQPTSDSVTIPLNRKARFIKLRILENQGGKYTSLGKVAIIEGHAPGYHSLLSRPVRPLASKSGAAPELDPSLVTSRVRPGLSPENASALELGKRIKAPFKDYSQRHYYSLDLRGDQPGMLNLELVGLPFLRTKLILKDSQGHEVAVFEPQRNSSPETIISWLVEPGKYLLQAESTSANIVLAWDVSGSMAKHTDLLQKAVTGFIEHVQPSERLALIAFNNNLHVLTDGFTNDKAKLLAAVSDEFKAEMATRLYDAVEKGIKLLSGTSGAGAMVVMTDGVDMGSRLKYPQFWELLDTNPVRMFAIGLGSELKVNNPKEGLSGSRLLRHMAMASGGRFIYVPNVDQLVDVYKQVAQELMSGTTYYLQPTWTFKPGTLLVKTQGERIAQIAVPPRIELVLDGSGSMNRRIGGKSRMEIAKQVLVELIEQMPPDVEVALRIYGHRIREGRPGDCQDTELVYPFGKLNKAKLISQIKEVKPLGTTPIAYALQQTIQDFGPSKGEKTIILVTDGKEECRGNLVKTMEDLRSQGLDVRLHVVGFAVKDPKTIAQMQQAAKAGKGRYLDAADQQGLKKAIAKTLAIPYIVRDSKGQEVARGVAGEELSLPAGYYNVVLDSPKGELVREIVRVEPNKSTLIRVTKDGPEIGVQVVTPDDAG